MTSKNLTLSNIHSRMQYWRKTRPCMGPIPEDIWQDIILLSKSCDHTKIRTTLGISGSQFRNRIISPENIQNNFLEIDNNIITNSSTTAVALHNKIGCKLVVNIADQDLDTFILKFMKCCN